MNSIQDKCYIPEALYPLSSETSALIEIKPSSFLMLKQNKMKAHSFRDAHCLGTYEKDTYGNLQRRTMSCQPLRSGHLISLSSLENAMLKITTSDQRDDYSL